MVGRRSLLVLIVLCPIISIYPLGWVTGEDTGLRKKVIIDGNNFGDLDGFYDEIDKVLTKDLTWKTGHNLDAFNDLLRGGYGVHERGEPLLLYWRNYAKSRKDFSYKATVDYYKSVLLTCHPSNRTHVKHLMEEAEQGKGKTLLDLIVEIFLNSNRSGHDCLLETDE